MPGAAAGEQYLVSSSRTFWLESWEGAVCDHVAAIVDELDGAEPSS
jgi:hypothetical protein